MQNRTLRETKFETTYDNLHDFHLAHTVYLSKDVIAMTEHYSRQRFGLDSVPEHYMWNLFQEKCSETGCSSNTSVFFCPHHSSSARYTTIRRGQKMYASEAVIKQKCSHSLPQRTNTNLRTDHHDTCLPLRT